MDDILSYVLNRHKSKLPALANEVSGPAHGYIRVSIEKQVRSGLGLEGYAFRTKQYAKFRGLDLIEPIFEDRAVSASKHNLVQRPMGSQLDARLKRGDHVIFPKLDRGFRNTRDMLVTTENWIARGITTHFVDLNVDTSQPLWSLLATMVAAMAQIEAQMIGVRTQDALAAIKRRGQRWGDNAPYGFKWAPGENGKQMLATDEVEMGQLRQIALWHSQGFSYERICKALREQKVYRRADRRDLRNRLKTGPQEWSLISIIRAHRAFLEYEAEWVRKGQPS